MKILHSTFLHGYNFGGALQALAIQRLLIERGHDVWSLDLPTSRRNLFVRKMASRSVIPGGALESAIDRLSFSNVREFEEFRAEHFQYTRPLHSMADARELVTGYDAYVVGSDQIWRNGWRKQQFIADLGSDSKILRLAVAACAGQFSTEDVWSASEQEAIQRFSAISVRNHFTQDVVSRYYPGKIEVVCDPTVACDLDLVPYAINEGGYILFYISNRGPRATDLARHALLEVKRTIKGQLISIPPSEMKGRDSLEVDSVVSGISPLQWAYLVKKANFVVTNSFHGVVFSVLYRQPFVALDHCANATARVREFLSELGLTDQMARNPVDMANALQRAAVIDWDRVHVRLSVQRQRFNAFLDSVLVGCG
jgi:hypothetical protein